MGKPVITFSIIIPTHQRPQQLAACLAAVGELNYPSELFEVIVIDDGAALAKELFVPNREINFTFKAQSQSGPATARNNGVKLSKQDFLVFLDDDCLPDADLLNAYAAEFISDPNLLLGGKTINVLPDNIFSSASQLLIDFLYDYFARTSTPLEFFTSNNIAASREIFLQINGFNQSFPLPAAEDRDFCRRWRNHQGKMRFVTAAKVYHAHYLTFYKFWRQHFNYGRGAYYFHQLGLTKSDKKIRLAPRNFYITLILFPFKQLGILSGAVYLVLFVFSQIAVFCGFCYEKCIKIV